MIRHYIHTLVGIYFVANQENKPEINHKKGIKTDNRFFELEWSTKSENILHSFRVGLNKPQEGILHGMVKLTNKIVLIIFNSPLPQIQLATKYKVSKTAIGNIKSGFAWSHITGKICSYKRPRKT